jgi:hypothetical protein
MKASENDGDIVAQLETARCLATRKVNAPMIENSSFPRRRDSSSFFPDRRTANQIKWRVAPECTFLDSRLRGNDGLLNVGVMEVCWVDAKGGKESR